MDCNCKLPRPFPQLFRIDFPDDPVDREGRVDLVVPTPRPDRGTPSEGLGVRIEWEEGREERGFFLRWSDWRRRWEWMGAEAEAAVVLFEGSHFPLKRRTIRGKRVSRTGFTNGFG